LSNIIALRQIASKSQFILFDYSQNACRWHFHQLFAIINDYATIRKYGDATKEQNQ